MAIWKDAFNIDALDPSFWEQKYGGPTVMDLESGLKLPRQGPAKKLAKVGAALAATIQSLPIIAAGVIGRTSGNKRSRSAKSNGRVTATKVSKSKSVSSMSRKSYKKRARSSKRSRSRYGKMRKKGKMSLSRKVRSLNNALRDVKRSAEADQGILTHRVIASTTCDVGVNTKFRKDLAQWDIPALRSCIAALRYFDPAVPGTLKVVDIDSPTFRQKINIKGIYYKIDVRNNGFESVVGKIMWCKVRTDTGFSPVEAIAQGLSNNPSGTLLANSPMTFISDSDVFNELYNITKTCQFRLEPGSFKSFYFNIPHSEYDPAFYDSHLYDYLVTNNCGGLLMEVEGMPVHDSTTRANVGLGASQLDVITTRTVKVEYAAGVKLRDVQVADSLDAIAVGPVQTNITRTLQ